MLAGSLLGGGFLGIAVGETVVSNLAGRAYLWAARDVENGEVMSLQVSRDRGLGECLRFLEKVKKRCRADRRSTRIGVHGMYGLRRFWE